MYKAEVDKWYLERITLLTGAVLILLGILFSLVASDWWLLLSAFVALAFVSFATTGYCPFAMLLRSLGVKTKLEAYGPAGEGSNAGTEGA